MQILNYSNGGLFFSYDLLGYGMMALSTFFVGLTIDAKNKADQWLKCLMIIHGIFFFGCFIINPFYFWTDKFISGYSSTKFGNAFVFHW